LLGRYETAIGWAERVIARMPTWHFGYFLLAASLVALGEQDRARQAVARCKGVLPETTLADLSRVPLRDAARMEEFRAHLREAGFED
ncbi:MAG: hypothetical protein WB783_19950, partial [Arenicellales bacterium]